MKIRILAIILISLTVLHLFGQGPEKPRLLVTTDIGGDPDDQQSLVRLMVYATPLKITANPGKSITLDATRSSDPDGHSLIYEWEVYPDGVFTTELLNIDGNGIVNLTVPVLKNDEDISLVLKVRDKGTPHLVSYKRILIENP